MDLSMAPVWRSRSSSAISATPFAMRPEAVAKGASSRVTYVLMTEAANLPMSGTKVRTTMVRMESSTNSKLR